MKSRTGTLQLLIIIVAMSCIVLPVSAQPPRTGWFIGGSFNAFEFAGSGDIQTVNGDVTFDVQARSAYGLVTNKATSTYEDIGFAWTNNQMPGGKLSIGYRSNFHFVTHLDLFWAWPKTEELQGYEPDDLPDGAQYLEQQATHYSMKTTRLMLDWRPFEPLPLWFFTVGVEYVEFTSRLEFRWQEKYGDTTYREYEAYEDDGSAFGGVIGSGLQFTGEPGSRSEWFVVFTYSYSPFTGPLFAWDGDFLVGGMALEGGFRVYLGED
ncbi:hypothetical protein KQI52_12085 [bacterium]|nr:hypothetical protein [bacterium]